MKSPRLHTSCKLLCAPVLLAAKVPAISQVSPSFLQWSSGHLGHRTCTWSALGCEVVTITWVPGCSTAQVRADFSLAQQLSGCHPPTTHPYLKMHLCSQQLLVELRVLQDMVAMANALSFQEINCLKNMGKPCTASEHQLSSCLPRDPCPTTGPGHAMEPALGRSFSEPLGPDLCLGP